MALAGGGHSHSDMFTWFGATIVSGLLGACTAPALATRLLAIRELRRVASANREPALPRFRRFFLSLSGAGLAAFLSWTFFYYSEEIAELPPEAGGPSSHIPGNLRATATLIASAILAVIALLAFIAAMRSAPVRDGMGKSRSALG